MTPLALEPTMDDQNRQSDDRECTSRVLRSHNAYSTHTEQGVTESSTTTEDQSRLLAVFFILSVIAVPVILLAIVLVNLSGTILAAILFEFLGHAFLRACGRPGFEIRLQSSLKVGAVGGAILSIPFNITYALLESYVSPQIALFQAQGRSEQDERRPLLSPEGAGRTNSFKRTFQGSVRTFNDSLKRTRRNPFDQRLRSNRVDVVPQSKWRTWLALAGDLVSGPLLGGLAGAVGSFVLGRTGHEVMSILNATEAGLLGGAILGALSALIFTGVYARVFALLSNQS